MIENKLSELKQKITEFTLLAEKMIDHSIDGLVKKDIKILKEVINTLEPKANNLEIEIEELSMEIIAQFAPKAFHLRMVVMILKINNDLERICDHAVNICESGIFLAERIYIKPLIDIPLMAKESIGMLKDSIESYMNQDAKLAIAVCSRDEKVDGLRNQITRELLTYMISDPTTIERALQLLRITHNLERIADLSTNICEDVIFMIEGKIIKHHIDSK